MQKLRALFLAANPTNTARLRLDEEIHRIESRIEGSLFRDSFELISKMAARPDDLIQLLNKHRPHIVHFSGHGNMEELIFQDENGEMKTVSIGALAELFKTVKDEIQVVVLNACFSKA
jgi:hypothetical protein